MRPWILSRYALKSCLAATLLAGCSGGSFSTPTPSSPVGAQANHLVNGHFVPQWSQLANLVPVDLRPSGPRAVLDRVTPDKLRKKAVAGVYGSEYGTGVINGYKGADPKNGPPVCSLTASYPNDIAVDSKGNLIDPDSGTRSVIVYKGPKMCGPSLGAISDSYGQPVDAASANAAIGTIVVANIYDDTNSPGSISVCTLKDGCTTNLTNPNMYEVVGVALAKNGDCWASAVSSGSAATLTYFKGCSGSGQAATGWKNTYYGGLDIDAKGNIASIDYSLSQLWIYSGCNPACTVVAGPFALHGASIFGHLNRMGTEYIAADFANGMLDVYKYSTSALTYEYSISNGLSNEDDVEGAAFSPRSKE